MEENNLLQDEKNLIGNSNPFISNTLFKEYHNLFDR